MEQQKTGREMFVFMNTLVNFVCQVLIDDGYADHDSSRTSDPPSLNDLSNLQIFSPFPKLPVNFRRASILLFKNLISEHTVNKIVFGITQEYKQVLLKKKRSQINVNHMYFRKIKCPQ